MAAATAPLAASLAANQVARTGFKQLQPEALEQFEYYTVRDASSNWSIKLSPLDNKDQQATVIACDARVMLGEHDAVVYQRFDLVPENFKQIQLSLPGDAALIGVWVAGRPVAIDPASAESTMGVLLKYQDDISRISGSEAARILTEIQTQMNGFKAG